MLVKIPSGEHLVAFAVCNPINTFIQKKKIVKILLKRVSINFYAIYNKQGEDVQEQNKKLDFNNSCRIPLISCWLIGLSVRLSFCLSA